MALVGASLSLATTTGAARAYTIESAASTGCHEAITSQALRNVRAALPGVVPLPASDDERALIDDLQFSPGDDVKDLAGATLLVAVRDNDLKGLGSGDLTALAGVHGNPNAQFEHCLRSPTEKEPGGSAAAIADCRAFIRGRVQEALDGLDAGGNPDIGRRTAIDVHLSLRGDVHAPLPTYYVRIGQAIHALEDSFTHTFRTADGLQVTVVLNWVDQLGGNADESRDGPPHESELDRCDDPDDLRKLRHGLAIDAATALMVATLDPARTRDQKLAAVDTVLDRYLSYSPGCTFDNHWCNAPEYGLQAAGGCGCGTGKIDGDSLAVSAGLAVALLALARRARGRRRAAVGSALALAMAGTLAATPARADGGAPAAAPASDPKPPEPPTDPHEPPPPTTTPVTEPGPVDPSETALGGAAMMSASFDKAALAGALGVRLRTSKHWAFGLDGEWNPWIALNGTALHRGSVNVYGSAILRFPLAYENFNLRTTASVGASYLLTPLYGAPSGSLGIYLGISPLGLEWKASRVFYVIINPINIAVPAPQLRGVPFLYPQYRTTVGLEFYGG